MTEIKRFVGKFEVRNSSGKPKIYQICDAVEFEGNWFNSSVGKLFIYIKDKDTEQWIEL